MSECFFEFIDFEDLNIQISSFFSNYSDLEMYGGPAIGASQGPGPAQ